jgi:hypothetical protein
VRTFEGKKCCRLIHSRWTRRWRRSRRPDGANRSLLLRRFDP